MKTGKESPSQGGFVRGIAIGFIAAILSFLMFNQVRDLLSAHSSQITDLPRDMMVRSLLSMTFLFFHLFSCTVLIGILFCMVSASY